MSSVFRTARVPRAHEARETRAVQKTQARYPSLYEINTRVWLRRLSREAGRPITLRAGGHPQSRAVGCPAAEFCPRTG